MTHIKDVEDAFRALRAGRRSVGHSSADQRILRLRKLAEVIEERASDIGNAIHADLGRPVEDRSEVDTVLNNIAKATDELHEWMEPTAVETTPGLPPAKAVYVKYEPRGVVLLFGTWDFPIGMFFSPLVQAIAAGNVVLGKTNSMAPATAKVIEDIVQAAFPANEVRVFSDSEFDTADGPRYANDVLLDLPVDHIFLTGSPRVGRLVVAAASKHLASFTLELGGKSPAILDETADLAHVAQQLLGGKIYNHGQTCLSVDYIWVPESLRERFVETYVSAVKDAYYEGDTFQWQRDGRFVDQRNYDRVKGYLDQAIARGAKVAFGGRADAETLTIEPTVLLDVPEDCDVVREELFAPILPVLTYTDEEQIYAHSDSLGKPLGLYIYSHDDAFIERVLDNTSSGGVTVNAHNVHWREENLPFGGVNSSGYGRYHGVWGFRELSNARSVYHVDA